MNKSLERLLAEIDVHITPIPADRGFTVGEYAAARGISENKARHSVNKAVSDGLVERIGQRSATSDTGKRHQSSVYDFVKAKCKSKK